MSLEKEWQKVWERAQRHVWTMAMWSHQPTSSEPPLGVKVVVGSASLAEVVVGQRGFCRPQWRMQRRKGNCSGCLSGGLVVAWWLSTSTLEG